MSVIDIPDMLLQYIGVCSSIEENILYARIGEEFKRIFDQGRISQR